MLAYKTHAKMEEGHVTACSISTDITLTTCVTESQLPFQSAPPRASRKDKTSTSVQNSLESNCLFKLLPTNRNF